MENIEIEEFFDRKEIINIFKEDEIFLSFDINQLRGGAKINIFENKSASPSTFPNTLIDIGKKYSCEKKIRKYTPYSIVKDYEFSLKIKMDKKGVFEYSSTLSII